MSQLRLGIPDKLVFRQPPAEMLPSVSWTPPTEESMPSWAGAKRIGIDLECKDPNLKQLGIGVRRSDSRVVGIGFAIEDGPEHYLSISHEGGDNCNWDVWQYVRDQLKTFKGEIVGNGLGYDLDYLEENGCNVLNGRKILDVQVLDVLLNELYSRYDLDAICARHGLPGKDETVLKQAAEAYKMHPKKDLWKMPARYSAQYGAIDARRPLQVLRRQERVAAEEGVEEIWKLEQRVTPILVKMRRRGVRVDINKLDMIEKMAIKEEKDALDEVHGMTGVQIGVGNVWKPQILARALATQGFKPPLTPVTKKASVDKTFLSNCGKVGKTILRAREWSTLRGTFCGQVRRAEINGRVHCTFNQLRATDDEGKGRGVRYGRLSSANFNFQNQPIRHEVYGAMWRSVFVADEGARWGCSDWSQQEPRIGVHYAELLGLPGAVEFASEYRKNPDLDIHQKLADITCMPRVIVKNFVNGRLYGMGDTLLCKNIGMPTEFAIKVRNGEQVQVEVPGPEGQAKIDEFNKFAPWVVGLTRKAANAASKNGFVWTMLRRKCRFEQLPDGKYKKPHKAFNRVGQGTAADQMKATLVACDDEGIPVQAAVHDEFDLSFDDIAVPKRVKELQMSVVTFNVPMKVDLEIGPNWGELEKVV